MQKITDPTVELFLKAVQVDSPSFSEKAMTDFLAEEIARRGWDCEIHRQTIFMKDLDEDSKARLSAEEREKSTEQMQVVIEGNDPSKAAVFFCAHIDTVEPGKNIRPVIDGDKIRTDGTTVLGSDDKAGVCAMITAVDRALKENLPHGKIVLVFDALEEKGLLGARFVPIRELGVDYGFVFDTMGSVGQLVERVQHSHSFEIRLKVKDIPNHSHAFLVPNALTIASELIVKLPKGLWNKEEYTFLQVSNLKTSREAGYGVPNEAVITGTMRSFVKGELELLRMQFEEIVKNFSAPNTEITYDVKPQHTLGYDHTQTETGRLMIQKAEEALTDLGRTPEHSRHGLGGHDASIFVEKGVPTMVLSCGMQDIHTTKEWIYLQDLTDSSELIYRLIRSA